MKHEQWKSLKGDYLGDLLYFKSDRWPTSDIIVDGEYNIYFNSIKKGRVINTISDLLTIITLDGRRGYYIAK